MKKRYILVLCTLLGLVFGACNDDECDQWNIDADLMGIPVVMKGTFPLDKLTPVIGDSVVFAPRLLDTTGVTYSWNVNGKEVSTDSVFVYRIDKPCRATVICNLKNAKGEVTLETSVIADHELSGSVIVVGDNGLSIYNPVTGKLYPDVYGDLNYGKGFSLGRYDNFSATLLNGKLYLVRSVSTSNVEHLFVADKSTLLQERAASVAANLSSFIPLSERQALITCDGALRMDLSSLISTPLLDDYGWGISAGFVFNGKLLANTSNYGDLVKVCYYDVAALINAEEKEMPRSAELEIWQDGRANFLEAADGYVYTVGCNEAQDEYYLIQIGGDFTVKNIPLPFKPLFTGYSDGLYTRSVVLSQDGNSVYISSDDQSIYRYVLGDDTSLSRVFIAAPDGDEELCGSGISVNPANGELWICYSGEEGKIVIYDVTGKKVKTIDCGETMPQAVLF